MSRALLAIAITLTVVACANNAETTRTSLIQRAEVLNAEADARVAACPTTTGVVYGRCIGAAYDTAMSKVGWPTVSSTPLSFQLAVVGERYDHGLMTENEALLLASQIINETVMAGAQAEFSEAERQDQKIQQGLLALGQRLQAQDQFNRAEALGYDRNNAIRSLGQTRTNCSTFGNRTNCTSY